MTIETDYLIVGAGAAGMGFTDTLIRHSDADVIIVDRLHRPGGHWNDDYPFVRLHQPSAYYGVDSRPLGNERIDETGPNAGFYERATGAEVCDYYSRVLIEEFLPTGRVRFMGMSDYVGEAAGEHRIASRVTGQTTTVSVRKKLVDATYLQTSIPSKHKPSFSVDPGVRLLTPNDLVHVSDPASGFTVLGAGKTSMDTCCWLIDQGVEPERIRWIRPRDPYVIDREWMQPLSRMDSMAEWLALTNDAAVAASDAVDLLRRTEENGALMRLDPAVEPTVYRGATLSPAELASVRSITNVVRLGRVLHVGTDHIDLAEGSIPTVAQQIHVDCTAAGIGAPPTRPIFEPGRITLQRVQSGVDPFSAALLGLVEAVKDGDEEKNALCQPIQVRGEAEDYASDLLLTLKGRTAWMGDAALRSWFVTTRLSPLRNGAEHLTERGRASVMRMLQSTPAAIENLERIIPGA
jgi:hypothetical protein